MKGESGLTKPEREMIAVVVSVANDCAYCMAAHGAALRKLTKDPALADAIAADHTAAPVEPRVRAMLDYAVKLTLRPTEMTESDVACAPRRGLERRGRHGHRRGDGALQHVESNGLGPRLGAEPRVRVAGPLSRAAVTRRTGRKMHRSDA